MTNNALIRLTKQFHFESAHALWNYDGPCRNIHGHSYILHVTVAGRPLQDEKLSAQGMLMDFSELKQIVGREVIEFFDHALVVNGNSPHKDLLQQSGFSGKIHAVPYQPTCENMIVDIAGRLAAALPAHVKLFSLRLHETATSYVEWFASDNP